VRRRRLWATVLAGVACIAAGPDARSTAGLARGDAAWADRARGASEDRATPGPILESVRAYASVVETRPDSLEARWKLLRSLHFAGTFSSAGDAERRGQLARATRVAETGLDRLAERTGGMRLDALDPGSLADRLAATRISPSDVARLHFWAALAWGSWSRTAGLLSVVREGVADRLHRYARVSLALEPGYEDGGAYRLLGRLHATLPRVPFLSGWVDRERAIPLVERAYAIAPQHPGNRLLLGLTLLDLAPQRRSEALELLDQVEGLTPRPGMRVEDLTLRREAGERLEAIRSGERA
jgi:hypothetical protein